MERAQEVGAVLALRMWLEARHEKRKSGGRRSGTRGCLGDEEVALLAKVEGEDSRRLGPGVGVEAPSLPVTAAAGPR